MKKIRLIIAMLVVITLALQGVNIFLSNKIAANSIHAAVLTQKIDALEEENQLLSTKVLEFSSLERIASRAGELGLVEKDKYISLYKPMEVAVR